MSNKIDQKLNNLSSEQKKLWIMRHSTEHVLTQAMSQLFPDSFLMAMGPATDDGFYFDFQTLKDFKISDKNFKRIEKQMYKIINQDLPFTRQEISPKKARELFPDNPYKQEWISEAESRGEPVTIYWTGKPDDKGSFVDLCAGPHLDSTGQIGAIKLLSIAGAYWRGDENNQMLTRVYGTAFPTKDQLKQYLINLEEAKKRDHKILGPKLDLFTFSQLVGAGLPLWTPKGTILRDQLDNFVWQLRKDRGYQRVSIPHITKKDLYQTSGHWQKFSQELFKIKTREKHLFAMKPMNCPHHTQIYKSQFRSYRDLPQRYAETTMVYRDEQSGELAGLSRVRCITQDDAHVFCSPDQVQEEAFKIWDIIETFYKGCGFPELSIRLSLHDPDNFDAYLGTKQQWLEAESGLRSMLQQRKAQFTEAPGEAAFYGPKIDFMTNDSLGRQWQVATIQIDHNMPTRFDLTFINQENHSQRVVMIHAAIMGSIERFLSILIEHFAGSFPLWLSPEQIWLIPIGESHQKYAQQLNSQLMQSGIRTQLQTEDSMQKRIRNAEKLKVPYMAIIGDQEIKSNSVSLRQRGQKDLGSISINELLKTLETQIKQKTIF